MTKRPHGSRAAGALPTNERPARNTAPLTEDLALWRHTARSVTPLRKVKARVPDIAPAHEGPPAAPLAGRPVPPEAQLQPPAAKAPQPAAPKRAAPSKAPPPLVPIERRKARRIARGHVEIDARLDLHGLRQADAERRLRTFLLRARAEGLRTVLVITGKGSIRDGDDILDASDLSARGILRRSVPLWLEAPELRDCVAGIAPAHVRHGGSGALYIHLRKVRRR
ncbi:MAG: Smr/MutS family protein [Hyphomicrobiaceae bacterium]